MWLYKKAQASLLSFRQGAFRLHILDLTDCLLLSVTRPAMPPATRSSEDELLPTPDSITPVDSPSASMRSLGIFTIARVEEKLGKQGWDIEAPCSSNAGSEIAVNSPTEDFARVKEKAKADILEKDVLPPPVLSIVRSDTTSTLAASLKSPATIMTEVRRHIQKEVDPVLCPLPLASYCFMTGFV